MKQFYLLLCMLAFGVIKSHAYYDYNDGQVYYSILSEQEKTVTVEKIYDKNKYSNRIILPNTVSIKGKDYIVTEIASNAFENADRLIYISIPNSVKIINDRAFYGCSVLYNVIFSEGLEEVKDNAFWGCSLKSQFNLPKSLKKVGYCAFGSTYLESVTIPAGIEDFNSSAFSHSKALKEVTFTEGCKTIGNYMFASSKTLEKVNLPQTMKYISFAAFENCSNLKKINIPISVDSIGYAAFARCTNLGTVFNEDYSALVHAGSSFYFPYGKEIRTIMTSAFYNHPLYIHELPQSIKYIHDYAFEGCDLYYNLVLPENLKHIGAYAFSKCTTGVLRLSIPESVEYIGQGAFSDIESLKTLTLPSKLKDIPDDMAKGCTLLSNFSIPYEVETIGREAFKGCKNLSNIVIPSKVKKIGVGCFADCTSLKEISCYTENVPQLFYDDKWFRITDPFSNTLCKEGILYVIGSSKTTYEQAEFWNNFAEIVSLSDALKYGSTFTVDDITYKTTSTEERTCQVISTNSIENINICDTVTYDNIGFCVTSIARDALRKNYSVRTITLPNSVTEISQEAFEDCSKLESIILPNNITRLSYQMLKGCTSLKSISIPESVITIESQVFDGCINIKNIIIPNSVIEISQQAFDDCTSLETVTIPASITNIGKNAFRGCSNLSTVYCSAETVPTTDATAFSNLNLSNCTLYVPSESIEEYKSSDPWMDFGIILPFGATPVNNATMSNHSVKTYSLNGTSQSSYKKGISIIRMNNGETRTVYIK